MVQKEIRVELGERSYSIHVGNGILSSLASACDQRRLPKQVVVITDKNVARWYLKPLEHQLVHFGYSVTPIVLPPGEQQKSLANANKIFTRMLGAGVGRKSFLIALGGGVIGDLAGFVAATYHRGIPLVQVPTTLLSQVDSSVGGKTAVNHPLGKNMIGAFHQPSFVWADVGVLKTLPFREVLCGLGEIIKYGVILDESLFSYLEANVDRVLALEQEAVLHVQGRCCALKADLVSQDERESGIRVVLNYGHTIGHALEAAGSYRVLKHGEAILLGMVAESFLAREIGLIADNVHTRITSLITRLPLSYKKKSFRIPAVMKAMSRDKKTVSGKKRFVLPVRVGETKVVEDVPQEMIKASIRFMLRQKFSG